MNRVLLTTCAYLLMVSGAFAQVWEHTFGGWGADKAFDILQTSDGGALVVGSTGSFGQGSGDAYALRLDGDGQLLWSTTLGGLGVEEAKGVVPAADGGFVLLGSTTSSGNGDYEIHMNKLADDGALIWQRVIGTSGWDLGMGIAAVPDGYVIVAQSFGVANLDGDVWLIRTDLQGDTLWSRAFGYLGVDEVHAVLPLDNGGFVFCGSNSQSDAWVVGTDDMGFEDWEISFGGDSADILYGMARASDGDILLTGETNSYAPHSQILLGRCDQQGALDWSIPIGNGGGFGAYDITERADGNLAAVGYTEAFGQGGMDWYLLVTDPSGNFDFGRTYGQLDQDVGRALCRHQDGGFLLAGSTRSYGPGIEAVMVLRTDAEGVSSGTVVEMFDDLSSVELRTGSADAGLFPNPAAPSDVVSFTGLDLSEHWSLSLFHASGRLVVNDVPLRKDKITLPELAPGIYTASVRSSTYEFRSRLCVQ